MDLTKLFVYLLAFTSVSVVLSQRPLENRFRTRVGGRRQPGGGTHLGAGNHLGGGGRIGGGGGGGGIPRGQPGEGIQRGGGGKRCFLCTGKFPERDCELYPKYTVQDTNQLNCSKSFCTTVVRYRPHRYLLTLDGDGELRGIRRRLQPEDLVVESVHRGCEEESVGNRCIVEEEEVAMTCFSTCVGDMCNDGLNRPSPDKTLQLGSPVFEEEPDYKADYDPDNFIDLEADYGTNSLSTAPDHGPPNNVPPNDVTDDVDDSELMITNKINDRFDVSSHGGGKGGGEAPGNFPHGSVTSAGRNMTAHGPQGAPPKRNRSKGLYGNDRANIKGKDKSVIPAKKGNNVQNKSKGQKGQDSGAGFVNSASCSIGVFLLVHLLQPLRFLS